MEMWAIDTSSNLVRILSKEQKETFRNSPFKLYNA